MHYFMYALLSIIVVHWNMKHITIKIYIKEGFTVQSYQTVKQYNKAVNLNWVWEKVW